jgi:hypothetical protein
MAIRRTSLCSAGVFESSQSIRTSVHGLIEPFYERVDREDRAIAPGHIWRDNPIYLPPRRGLKFTRVAPENDEELDFVVGGFTDEIYDHPPVQSMKLPSSEGATIAYAKKDRPVFVVGGMRSTDPLARRAQLLDAAMCVPIYGADQFERGFRARVRAYEFENLFYLPADEALGFDEGFARFDHVQPVLHGRMNGHRGLRLSEPAREALLEWFWHFLTGQIDEGSLVADYRREERARLASGE